MIKRNLGTPYILLYFALILCVWVSMFCLAQPKAVNLGEANGYYNLSEVDFSGTVYRAENYWESWPEALYTPEDFAGGAVASPPQFLPRSAYKSIPYATHRLRISLPHGGIYGISMLTSEYAMRLYIDGEEIDCVGTPGTTKETTEHRALERTYYFTTESGEVEFLVQAANFVHAKGGSWAPVFTLGTAANITQRGEVSLAVNFMVIGCLLTAFLYHLGLFCLNRRRKVVLVFALCCLLLAFLNKKLILMFWPNYIWQVGIRIEYMLHFSTFAMLVLFLHMLHPKLFHKWVVRSYFVLAALYMCTLFLDSLIFTHLLLYFEVISVVLIGYILVRMALALRGKTIVSAISFVGILVLGLLGANDILYYRGIVIIAPIAGQFFMTPVGMVFFVLCYAAVLSVEYAETEHAMQEAEANKQLLAAENASLERVSNLKTELMQTISHEARTPLAVLASYAGLVSMELQDKGVDTQTTADLDKIAYEAKRVAELIDSMKRLTLRSKGAPKRDLLDIGPIITQTAWLYRPILQRKGIALEIDVGGNLPLVLGNAEEITQVLFNLLQNAKNHTLEGKVTVTLRLSDGGIAVIIADTGAGIAPELLAHVFERGVSEKDGGSGIGLAICKEIIESHSGTISIESVINSGTRVSFTLPASRERDAHEK